MNLKIPHIPSFLFKTLVFLLISFNSVSYSYSQNMPVPENIQAALLPKVLKFNSKFSAKEKLKILVVYDNNSSNSKDEFVKELGRTMIIKAIRANELENNISGNDLVYFMSGSQYEAVICKRYKVLSVTGISQYVENGQISLGFGIQNNKPKILVNLTSLERESQSFSSDLLRIAKIFN